MQKSALLFLVMCSQTYAMDLEKTKKPFSIMVAAWVVTPQTILGEYDQIIISKYPNGMHGIKHFSRPNGMRETRCDFVSVFEVVSPALGSIQELVLKNHGDTIELAKPQEAWYKHPVATHSFAVLTTLLAISALYR